jgi:hypothetical protein
MIIFSFHDEYKVIILIIFYEQIEMIVIELKVEFM